MDLVSTRSTRYKQLGLAEQKLSDDEWLDLLAHEPQLLRRPLVTDGTSLVVGYNEEALEQLRTRP